MKLSEKALAMMREVGRVVILGENSDEALQAEIRDAHTFVVGYKPRVERSHITSADQLKHIARRGVGTDTIDVQAATERGIIVTNTAEVTADSVAEFTMTLLLSLAKNIPRCDRATREGRWEERSELTRNNIELNGKTHGIVGMGRIGRRVAVRCKAFGMRVLYYKRNRDIEFEGSAGVEYVPFETLIKESDSISLHIPLTDGTINLLDKAEFDSMKKTALLINQARGKVVNEEALVHALREGQIGGYATDVYETEPPDPKNELFRFKNTVVTPHVGGSNRDSGIRSSIAVAEDVIRVLRGDLPKNLVNKEVLGKGPFKE
jgi:D-3-phosphoglycerate dehydrogenase